MDARYKMFLSFVLWSLIGCSVQIPKLLPEDRDSLVDIALNVQNVDTGYPDETYTETDIESSSIVTLTRIIEAKVDRLYCRYMFSVVNHMDSTRALFHDRMGDEQIECIASFKDVAQEMIGTLYGLGDQEMDGLWLFNVYVNELPKYFKSVTTEVDSSMSVELADKLANVHRVVTRYLKYAAFARPCMDWKILKNALNQSQSADCYQQDNLNSVRSLMANNRRHGVVSFPPAQLYLRKDLVEDQQLMAGLQLLVSDLQIEWNTFYARLTELNARAHDFLSLGHGPRSIDAYHELLFGFLELVIVRFARKHFLLTIIDINHGRSLSKLARKVVADDNDRQMDPMGLYESGNATMAKHTATMTRLFRIDNEWLNECILMLRKPIAVDNWNAVDTAGRQEERRIINKHHGRLSATEFKLNHTVALDTFQSVLKLASSRLQTSHDTSYLEKNVISPIQMNIITMEIACKYFANVLFKGVKFGILDLFRNRNKNDV